MRALTKDELPQALSILEKCNFQEQIFNQEISKESVLQLFKHSFDYEDSDLMGLFAKEELVAVWVLFHDDASLFATLTYGVFSIKDYFENLSIVFNWLSSNYENYQIIIGIRKTNQTVDNMLSHQAKLLMVADIYYWKLTDKDLVTPLKPLIKNQFLTLSKWYDETFPGIYWNSQKIVAEFENWIILAELASENSNPKNFMGILSPVGKKTAEVFTSKLETSSFDLFLTATKFLCQEKKATELYWMMDELDSEATYLKETGNFPKGTYKEFQLN